MELTTPVLKLSGTIQQSFHGPWRDPSFGHRRSNLHNYVEKLSDKRTG